MDNLFSTHPNTENRIAELETLAAELGVTARSAPRGEAAAPSSRSSAGQRGPWG
jgi:heat shock protein HtpX